MAASAPALSGEASELVIWAGSFRSRSNFDTPSAELVDVPVHRVALRGAVTAEAKTADYKLIQEPMHA